MSKTSRGWWIARLLAAVMIVAAGAAISTAAAEAQGSAEVRLIEAVKRGDVPAVRALAQQRVDVEAVDRTGATALHWAVANDNIEIVDLLIRTGANVQTPNRYAIAPLSLASQNGNAALAERLLKAGADANTTRPGGETALMTAARNGNPALVKLLLAHGAQVNATESTRAQTGLMWAATRNNAAAVQVLVEAGADLEARARGPESRIGDTETASESTGAVASKKRPRVDDYTALLFAVRAGAGDAVRTLLKAGANPNTAAPDGVTALMVSAFNAHWEIAAVLLDHGADPNASGAGWTMLHQVARTRNLSHFRVPHPVATGTISALDLVSKLIEKGANVNARAAKRMSGDGERGPFLTIGATPLLIAAKGFDADLMRLLLAKGADITIRNAVGTSVLMAAAACDTSYLNEEIGSLDASLEAVKVALEAGADVNEKNEIGDTALHGAAYAGAIPVAEYLIEKGAKLDAQNEHGWTPLANATLVYVGGNIVSQPAMATRLRQIHEQRGVPMVVRTIEEAYELARKVYLTRYKRGTTEEAPKPVDAKAPEVGPKPVPQVKRPG